MIIIRIFAIRSWIVEQKQLSKRYILINEKKNYMKTKLSKEELIAEYGLGSGQEKGGCSVSLKCAFGSISCSSDSGDCKKNLQQFEIADGEVIEMVTSITCDGKTYDCK